MILDIIIWIIYAAVIAFVTVVICKTIFDKLPKEMQQWIKKKLKQLKSGYSK